MGTSSTLKGHLELAVGAAVSRRGESSANEIYEEIVRVGDRAYLANVYAATERLATKGILRRRRERRVTADGIKRDVRLYSLTDAGRQRLRVAVDDAMREATLLQLTTERNHG